jgi:hypothetical protein
MEVRYYMCLPLSLFKWRTTIHKNYMPDPNQPAVAPIQTGVMDVENFLKLKEDIRINGCVNPLIVEYDNRELIGTEWTVRTGNNRAEAMTQLGMSRVNAILIGKPEAPWPEGGNLIKADELKEFLKSWKGITVDGRVYRQDAWNDCKALMEILL